MTTWGWIHLLVGLILAAVGIFLLLGKGWARIAGIVVAGISAIVNFSWLPYSPWWALLSIAVAILVIWALATQRQRSTAWPSSRSSTTTLKGTTVATLTAWAFPTVDGADKAVEHLSNSRRSN